MKFLRGVTHSVYISRSALHDAAHDRHGDAADVTNWRSIRKCVVDVCVRFACKIKGVEQLHGVHAFLLQIFLFYRAGVNCETDAAP